VGDYNAIADVSSILQDTLNAALANLEPAGLTADLNDLTGTIPTNPPRVTIFLYDISEDAASRNRPHIRAEPTGAAGPQVSRKPPMALLLRYLITAWGGDQITQHRMLGRVMQTLYDDAILDGGQLTGSLAGTTDALHVTCTQLTLDQKSWVWFALQKPFRLSLNYEVRVVNLESTVDIPARPVLSRSLVAGTTTSASTGVAAAAGRTATTSAGRRVVLP
jgi:hypothetical protein